jgi:hypothetical protein
MEILHTSGAEYLLRRNIILCTSDLSLRQKWHSQYTALRVIDVKSILSMVAIISRLPFPGDTLQRYFVVEKPGLDIAVLGGVVEMSGRLIKIVYYIIIRG